MNINEYLEITKEKYEDLDYSMLKRRPRIVCADGFDVSIQASQHHYCTPRVDDGPYSKVEIGYPSEEVPEWMEWAETPESPLDTVYGWVPVEIIDEVLRNHGGIANGVE